MAGQRARTRKPVHALVRAGTGAEIQVEDLPPELVTGDTSVLSDSDWALSLRTWADRAAMSAHGPLLDEALPRFERALIGAALKRTPGT